MPNPAQAPTKPLAVAGDGLAGTALVQALLQAGFRVLWLAPGLPGASQAAAGLLNPVAGKRLTLAQPIEPLYAALRAWRTWPGAQAGRAHVQPAWVYRPYRDTPQRDLWTKRLQEPAYKPFLREQAAPHLAGELSNPLGGLWVRGAAAVDIPGLLQAVKAELLAHPRLQLVPQVLQPSELDPDAPVAPGPEGPQAVAAVVFAGGWKDHANPWWPGPPLQAVRGQLLTLYAPNLHLAAPLSGPLYILPRGAGRFVLGATFERGEHNPTPTSAGRERLLAGWRAYFPNLPEPEVLAHRAGVRAALPDHRPAAGPHPAYPRLWFVNGLGSKGLLYAPLLAKVVSAALANWLLAGGQRLAEWPTALKLGWDRFR